MTASIIETVLTSDLEITAKVIATLKERAGQLEDRDDHQTAMMYHEAIDSIHALVGLHLLSLPLHAELYKQ